MTKPGVTAEADDVTPSAPGRPGHQLLRDKLVGRRIGRYDVLHRIASGGMGSVYVGRARAVGDFERLVAIKVLHEHLAHQDDFIGMFLDEARLAAQIRHPNVVATVDVCPTAEGYFLVMDYVEGDHLGSLLRAAMRSNELLPVPVVLRVVLDSLMGLAAAHGLKDRSGAPLNLVHRDISPQNVLVGVDGMARLTDFGVAKAEHRISSTREGQFKGKLAYASPEQAATGEVEQRSDLFAMGVVMWEALTAKRLFGADTNQATLRRLLDEPIPKLSSARPDLAALDDFMAKALARPLGTRFQTAQEMADAIETIAETAGGLATTRAVAQAVRELAKDKLDAEQAAIEKAIADRKAISDRPTSPTETAQREEVDTLRPPALGNIRGRSRGRHVLVAALLGLVIAAGVWWAMRSGAEVAGTQPAPSDEPVATAPEVEPSVEAEEDQGEAAATAPAPREEAAEQPEAAGDAEHAQPEAEVGEETERERAEREARERAERRARLRAARRRAARQAAMETEMTAMDETDILVNPYRNR